MTDLLTTYGPNMAALQKNIDRRVANASNVAEQAPVKPEARMKADAQGQYSEAELARAHAAAQDFEAFFISQMLQPMFSEINTAPPFGGGNAERIWRSMMLDEYGNMIAKSGGIGVSDAVLGEMLKNQET